MTFQKTTLPGVVLIEPIVFGDERGFFMESYHEGRFAENGIDVRFVQDNVSRSSKGTFRGLHYQMDPHAQGKLVRVPVGEVWDVVVDIRKGSPTYGKYEGFTLSEKNKHMLWVPPGFAHGFLVLSDLAEFSYKCSGYYAPQVERSIRWDDPDLAIQWPSLPDRSLISKKDMAGALLKDADNNYIWHG